MFREMDSAGDGGSLKMMHCCFDRRRRRIRSAATEVVKSRVLWVKREPDLAKRPVDNSLLSLTKDIGS